MRISLVVITLNEADKLGDCLKSVAGLVDEMLVVDSGSTDGTQSLAESLGARVVYRPFKGHIEQKNAAAQLAQHDWVLSLDADERLDAEARSEIAGLKLQGAQKAAYGWRRRNHYGEQAIRHGAWYPDRKLRLWKKQAGRWMGTNPHDRWECAEKGSEQWLRGHILHFSFKGPHEHRQQADRFASIAAQAMKSQGRNASALRPYVHSGIRWVRDYIWLGGFLDGKAGWHIAGINAWEAGEKYRRLRELNKN